VLERVREVSERASESKRQREGERRRSERRVHVLMRAHRVDWDVLAGWVHIVAYALTSRRCECTTP